MFNYTDVKVAYTHIYCLYLCIYIYTCVCICLSLCISPCNCGEGEEWEVSGGEWGNPHTVWGRDVNTIHGTISISMYIYIYMYSYIYIYIGFTATCNRGYSKNAILTRKILINHRILGAPYTKSTCVGTHIYIYIYIHIYTCRYVHVTYT